MKTERINSIAILIIALTAVVVSVWQINLMRTHNKLTVKPFIKMDNIQNGDEIEFRIKNKGEGAAIIKSFSIEVKGMKYNTWQEAFSAIDSTIQVPQTASIEQGDIISKGELYTMCTIKKKGGEFIFDITLSVEFESLYQEPGSISLNMSHTIN